MPVTHKCFTRDGNIRDAAGIGTHNSKACGPGWNRPARNHEFLGSARLALVVYAHADHQQRVQNEHGCVGPVKISHNRSPYPNTSKIQLYKIKKGTETNSGHALNGYLRFVCSTIAFCVGVVKD
jgi:hypothetical protein